MDLSFFRRAEQRFASRVNAAPDFGMLLAMLRTQQAATPAARAEAEFVELPQLHDPLVELLLGGPQWRLATALQRGSFNSRIAAQGAVN